MTHIDLDGELRKPWPRIGFALSVGTSGYVHADYFLIVGRMDHRRVQGVERAEAWEELAAFYEWRFEQRAGELANDPAFALPGGDLDGLDVLLAAVFGGVRAG